MTIPLTRGAVAQISDSDAAIVALHKWCIDSNGYVVAKIGGKKVALHRFLVRPAAGSWIDHANGDRLDNRRENLRVCTPTENARNRATFPHSSRFKGVFFDTERRKFRSQIRANGRLIHLGRFAREEDAAAAYAAAERRHFGDFAREAS